MTLCWLSDAVSVSLTIAHAHDTPWHRQTCTSCMKAFNLLLDLHPRLKPFPLFAGIKIRDGVLKAEREMEMAHSKILPARFRLWKVGTACKAPRRPRGAAKACSGSRDNASLVHVRLLYYRKSHTCNFCVALPSPRLSLQHESLFFCQLALLNHEIHWVEHKRPNVVKIDVNLIFNDALPGSCRIFSKNV